jgi:hypothetical protein
MTTAVTSDYTLAASPTAVTVAQGSNDSASVAITRTGEFTGSVAFSATGCPPA